MIYNVINFKIHFMYGFLANLSGENIEDNAERSELNDLRREVNMLKKKVKNFKRKLTENFIRKNKITNRA